jgi:hypothetical protein
MKSQTIQTDINNLEKALKIIEKTECYRLFNKSHLIFEMCEQINVLREKLDKQTIFLNSMK